MAYSEDVSNAAEECASGASMHANHSELSLLDFSCLLVTLSCHCVTFSIPLLAFLALQSKNGHKN